MPWLALDGYFQCLTCYHAHQCTGAGKSDESTVRASGSPQRWRVGMTAILLNQAPVSGTLWGTAYMSVAVNSNENRYEFTVCLQETRGQPKARTCQSDGAARCSLSQVGPRRHTTLKPRVASQPAMTPMALPL
ncbi:hypothetical protein AX14_011642 [Amanita brunnescens Koide BX004]|nr:hypothetical protein AX14_011642 [Amanita brunnescens Koide BX004]